jgi:hypothetical protein
MILVSNPVFKVKEFIEMVHYSVEGLLDDNIQDGRRLKGKTHYPHYSDYYGIKCYVVRVREFIKLLN